jgi:hypothetical protein
VKSSPSGKGATCDVEVSEGSSKTRHRVHLTPADLERWGHGERPEDLVRRSFEFLLEREPKESILREFDLSVIQRYFPEYDRVIRREGQK